MTAINSTTNDPAPLDQILDNLRTLNALTDVLFSEYADWIPSMDSIDSKSDGFLCYGLAVQTVEDTHKLVDALDYPARGDFEMALLYAGHYYQLLRDKAGQHDFDRSCAVGLACQLAEDLTCKAEALAVTEHQEAA